MHSIWKRKWENKWSQPTRNDLQTERRWWLWFELSSSCPFKFYAFYFLFLSLDMVMLSNVIDNYQNTNATSKKNAAIFHFGEHMQFLCQHLRHSILHCRDTERTGGGGRREDRYGQVQGTRVTSLLQIYKQIHNASCIVFHFSSSKNGWYSSSRIAGNDICSCNHSFRLWPYQ